MEFHGGDTDYEAVSDLGVGEAFDEQRKDFYLALG